MFRTGFQSPTQSHSLSGPRIQGAWILLFSFTFIPLLFTFIPGGPEEQSCNLTSVTLLVSGGGECECTSAGFSPRVLSSPSRGGCTVFSVLAGPECPRVLGEVGPLLL